MANTTSNDNLQDQKQNGAASVENKGPGFGIQRIYVKDLSFETSNTPAIFKETWQPSIDLDINSTTHKVEDNVFEVVLRITATAKSEEKTAFIAEVQQAGIFIIQGINEQQLHHMLGSYCPNILFPYAREVISDMILRGSFPPLYLAPVNFDAVYEQQMKPQQKPEESQEQT